MLKLGCCIPQPW